MKPRVAPSVTPRFPPGFVAGGLERGDSDGVLRAQVFSDRNVARSWVLLQVVVDRASIDASFVNITVCNWLKRANSKALSPEAVAMKMRIKVPIFLIVNHAV